MVNPKPNQGKWTVTALLKRIIEEGDGEMPVEDLLSYMKQRGYLKEPLRQRLEYLGVEVVDGQARVRRLVGPG